MQRCQWHKRENVAGYLPKGEQDLWRRWFAPMTGPTDAEAYSALGGLQAELEDRNQSAGLPEGLEETLTLHRLGSTACSALP